MIRTTFVGPPSGRSWVAYLQAWSRSEIHRYASAVLYAWRGRASALGHGGGAPALDPDWHNWRTWPTEDETDMDELEDLALRLYQRVTVRKNSEMVDILVPLLASLRQRSTSPLPKRFTSS